MIIVRVMTIILLTSIIYAVLLRKIRAIQLVYEVRLITGTWYLAGIVNGFNSLTIALAQWHKGVDAIRTISLHALRISQVTGNGIPHPVTPVLTV